MPLMQGIEPQFRQAKNKYFITYQHLLNPTVYTQIKDSGILLTLRYLCPPQKRRDFEQAVIEEILSQFAKYDDINFAYPTTRFYKANEGAT